MLIRRFAKSIIDLHVVINVWSTSCRVRYVVRNVTVKLMTNSDTRRTIIKRKIRKFSRVKIIKKQAFLLTFKQLAAVVVSITLK